MSKRRREDIEKDIVLYTNKKRAVERLLARAIEERVALNAEEAAGRAIQVPWRAYVEAASRSNCAWVKESYDSDLYEEDYPCGRDDGCYYQNGGDVKFQTLFVIRPVDGTGRIICDVDFADRRQLFDEQDEDVVQLDPIQFEPAIATALSQAATLLADAAADEDEDEMDERIRRLFKGIK
jgi:hypothetical protein